jgi:tetratricopeptide (TPR) repeat protein
LRNSLDNFALPKEFILWSHLNFARIFSIVKRPQWITLATALVLVAILYLFGRIVPEKKTSDTQQSNVSDNTISTDTILAQAKKRLSADQISRLDALEHSVVRGNVKDQQLKVYHQLAHFWLDTAQLFEPYALYEAEAARLENSEKSLTFAAHLFLQNLRGENDPALRTWKALQAKDLFERSLKINPNDDSSTVGLGACYIFGNISATPMEGIIKVRTIAEKDSTNIFAQEVLGHGSMLSGQYDKAIARFESVYRLSKENMDIKLEACLMLAEAYERKADKSSAITWYEKSLDLIKNEEVKEEVKKRIDELKK